MLAPVQLGFALVCFALVVRSSISAIYNRLIEAANSLEPSVLQHYLFHYLGVTVNVAKSGRWIGTLDQLKLDSLAAFIAFAAACLLALFANIFININNFSLHGMYRMRLTRSYL